MRVVLLPHSHASSVILLFSLAWYVRNASARDSPSALDVQEPQTNMMESDEPREHLLGSGSKVTVHRSHILDDFHSLSNIDRNADYLRSLFGLTLPVNNATKSFWLDTPGANPLAEEGSTGELTQDADVCIIGSGITGVSAAWHLSNMFGGDAISAEEKPSIVILEAREFCSGATGRNGGHLVRNVFSSFISRQASHNTSEAIKTYLLEKYTAEALVDFITQRNLQDKVDLVEGGHITMFRTHKEETDARNDFEAATAAGLGDMLVRWIGNDELAKDYGLSPALNYTGVWYPSHSLWPCKLVTELFQEAQSLSNIALHTKTPVTSVMPPVRHRKDADDHTDDQTPLSLPKKQRRWTLGTPRGNIQCSYVVHATNAYTGYLLPFMADGQPPKKCPESRPSTLTFMGNGKESLPLSERTWDIASPTSRPSDLAAVPVLLPDRPHHPISAPRRVHTIVPTRGQVGAVRASVNASAVGWRNAWDGGGGGWEYWFPRYQDTNSSAEGSRNPLIILGGGREFSGGRLEAGVMDDSALNPFVSTALREFLPAVFPGQFSAADEGWEMEWTGIMGFTKSGEPFVGPVGPLIDQHSGSTGSCHNEGQYIAAGYSGHGMPRAYACAEAVAGMIKAKMQGEKWTMPDWLPESYLTTAKH